MGLNRCVPLGSACLAGLPPPLDMSDLWKVCLKCFMQNFPKEYSPPLFKKKLFLNLFVHNVPYLSSWILGLLVKTQRYRVSDNISNLTPEKKKKWSAGSRDFPFYDSDSPSPALLPSLQIPDLHQGVLLSVRHTLPDSRGKQRIERKCNLQFWAYFM